MMTFRNRVLPTSYEILAALNLFRLQCVLKSNVLQKISILRFRFVIYNFLCNLRSDNFDRSYYGSSDNLIHRLFVCVAGIADQLQTNYSQDIRSVLKMVLQPVEAVPIYEVWI